LLDDEVSLLRFETLGRRGAPGSADDAARLLDALEQRRVQLETRRARLDDVPDVDDRDASLAARRSEILDVLDDVLLLRTLRGARIGPDAPFDHDVVLQVLDQHRAAGGIELQLVVHGVPPTSCTARGAGRRASGSSTATSTTEGRACASRRRPR